MSRYKYIINQKIMSLNYNPETAATAPIKERLLLSYIAATKRELEKIISLEANEEEIEAQLIHYLQDNWEQIKNTSLSYTANPRADITKMLCEIAETICAERNKKLTNDQPPI